MWVNTKPCALNSKEQGQFWTSLPPVLQVSLPPGSKIGYVLWGDFLSLPAYLQIWKEKEKSTTLPTETHYDLSPIDLCTSLHIGLKQLTDKCLSICIFEVPLCNFCTAGLGPHFQISGYWTLFLLIFLAPTKILKQQEKYHCNILQYLIQNLSKGTKIFKVYSIPKMYATS